jgi:copper transport protein
MWKRIGLCIFSLLLGGSLSVWGHGSVESTEPADGSRLAESPARLRVWFNEPLIPETARFDIVNSQLDPIQPERVYHAEGSEVEIVADLPPKLPPDTYIVKAYAAVVSDGHESEGSFSFVILPAPAAAERPGIAYEGPLFLLITGALLVGGGYWAFMRRRPALKLSDASAPSQHFSLD